MPLHDLEGAELFLEKISCYDQANIKWSPTGTLVENEWERGISRPRKAVV